MITKKELLQMLSDTESYNIERTESTGNMDKFCQAICAFSNDISGSGRNGYLIIGAKDNGECQVCRLMINSYCRLPIFGQMATFSLSPP